MIGYEELSYINKLLKADAKEYRDKKKLSDLHKQCCYTCKTLVKEMVEGSVPICL